MLFCMVSALVVAGCLVPNAWLPPLPNDKLLHFGAFGVLAVLALRIAPHGWQAGAAMLGLLVAGWLIEVAQSLVPGRGFCWRDLGANAAGIAAGALLMHFVAA